MQAGQQIDKALSQQGINTKPVIQAGAQAIDTVKPAATNFFSWFMAQNLTVKAETVVAAAAVFYLGPSVLRVLGDVFQVSNTSILSISSWHRLSWFPAGCLREVAPLKSAVTYEDLEEMLIRVYYACDYQGYRGDLTAPGAVNTLTTDGKSLLIDIRRVGEREASGDPVLPPSAAKRIVDLEYSFTEVRQIHTHTLGFSFSALHAWIPTS